MDMQALLDSEAGQPSQLRRGEIVDGMVMGASPDGIIVDVGAKTEAVIPQNEMLSLGVDGNARLKAGDSVKVMVLQPSTAEGHGIVSLDRARGEEGWEILEQRRESGEIFPAQVVGNNRGGLLVNVEGVNAFVPLSQVDSVRRDDPEAVNQLASLVGQELQLKVHELNRRKNRAILSERAAMAEWRKGQKDRVLDDLQEGEIREGRVSSITDFGVFVDLGGADGLAHMTELTWERGKKAKDLFTIGDTVKAYILKVDQDTRKISLSLKRAHPEEWDDAVDRFVIGQILIGRVTKLMQFGAFVRLDGPVEGLIHISEITNRRIQHPKEVLNEGDVVPVKLVRIEKDRHRLGLSLRQSRADAEAMGFGFDRNGSVVDWPDDVRIEFNLGERDESQPRNIEPRSAQEAIERAVARDPEPVSAFAHAFAQALEAADGDSPFATASRQPEPAVVEPEAEDVIAEAPESIEAEVAAAPEAAETELAAAPEAAEAEVAEAPEVAEAEVAETPAAIASEPEPEAAAPQEEAPVAEPVAETPSVDEASVDEGSAPTEEQDDTPTAAAPAAAGDADNGDEPESDTEAIVASGDGSSTGGS